MPKQHNTPAKPCQFDTLIQQRAHSFHHNVGAVPGSFSIDNFRQVLFFGIDNYISPNSPGNLSSTGRNFRGYHSDTAALQHRSKQQSHRTGSQHHGSLPHFRVSFSQSVKSAGYSLSNRRMMPGHIGTHLVNHVIGNNDILG